MTKPKQRVGETVEQFAVRLDDYRSRYKKYYEEHKGTCKARDKAYREAHKEERKAYDKTYAETHKNEKRDMDKAYYEAHKDKIKAYQKAYYEENKEKEKERNKARYERNRFVKKGIPFGVKLNVSHGEHMTSRILSELGLFFETQKTFDWLVNKSNMFLDFYLPEQNVAIEYDGIQHSSIKVSSMLSRSKSPLEGALHFAEQKHRDSLKERLCAEHGIRVLRIPHTADTLEKVHGLITEFIGSATE